MNQLCKMYHLDLGCQYNEKCRRKHCFIIKSEDAIRRFQLTRMVPLNPVSKLTKFTSGGRDYFGMRNGMDINFFDFNCETKQLSDVYKFTFPDPNSKYTFYDQKSHYIYYARENPDTFYQDIGFINI